MAEKRRKLGSFCIKSFKMIDSISLTGLTGEDREKRLFLDRINMGLLLVDLIGEPHRVDHHKPRRAHDLPPLF